MSFKRYPKYAESGIDWLGLVPEHWAVRRVRLVAEMNPSKTEASTLDGGMSVSFLPMEAIGDDGSLSLERVRTVAELESGYTYFREGDVTLAKITPCFENGKGAVMRGLVNGVGFGTTELIVARPRPNALLSDYLHYVFTSTQFRALGESYMYGAGGQKRVPESFVRDFRTAFPPLEEQSCLVQFLDRETAKIDALIAEQQRLMELLQEKRQAVISYAVTKGLNPDVPMKPSGVEWLGDVPVHWAVAPLMRLTDSQRPIMYGIVLPGPDVGEGIPILKGGNVKPHRMNLLSMARTTPEIEAPFARARLRSGDLVYAIRGTIGDCEIVPEELEGSNITQDVARVAPASGVSNEWLRWTLLSDPVREELACGSLGAAVRGINIFDLKRVLVPVPPKHEQCLIAHHLREVINQLDALYETAVYAIELLAERRAALISAAVMGQIDVRAEVAMEAV